MDSSQTLRILFIASEADPLVKVGGLGDVTGSLPLTLRSLVPADAAGAALDVRLALPFHPVIARRVKDPELVATFDVPHPGGDDLKLPAKAYLTHLGQLPVYLISGEPIDKEAPIYSLNTKEDGERYTFFSLAALELARALDWQPDILHANDWHTALAVYVLWLLRKNDAFFNRTRSMLTVHNLPFMGAGIEEAMEEYGIPPLDDERLPEWGEYQPLPMGLATADFITTVSPTYAREIRTAEFGCGLQDFLTSRSDTIAGILNGLDEKLWNPAADTQLAAVFDRYSLERRIENKQALLKEMSLPANLDLPLLIFIGRMDWQKGVDLALEALRQIAGLPWQAVLLGSGDPALEAGARQIEAEFPFRMRSVIRFDARLARRMYAAGDMLLMPSRYEPCGLAQMIAMRYGCVPVARATGGLRDTVKDNPTPENSTGFLFEEATPEALAAALRRALAAFADKTGWSARQAFGMQQDFSWVRSARAYAQIYQELKTMNRKEGTA